MNTRIIALVFITCCLLFSTQALATDEGWAFEIQNDLVHNDNIFGQKDKISDLILATSPIAYYIGTYGKHEVTFNYNGRLYNYSDNSAVNFDEHKIEGRVDLDLTQRWTTKITAGYSDNVELPGASNVILTSFTEYTEFTVGKFAIETSYGRRNSKGQFIFSYQQQQFEFNNNDQEYRDRDSHDFKGTYLWRVAPKTRTKFQLRRSQIDADNVFGFNQSASQTIYLIGVDSDLTEKFQTSALVGYQQTSFDNDDIETIDGLSYFIDANYKPDTSSNINVSLSRTTRDNASNIVGGLETQDYVIKWENQLKKNMVFEAGASFRVDDFTGVSTSRTDSVFEVSTKLTYKAFRWLEISTGIKHLSRSSDLSIQEFDSNQMSLGIYLLI